MGYGFFFKKKGEHALLRSWPSNVCSAAANQVGYWMRMTTKRRKEEVKISMTTRDSRRHDSHAVPLVCRVAILLLSRNDDAAAAVDASFLRLLRKRKHFSRTVAQRVLPSFLQWTSTHQVHHHEGWMVSVQETVFCWVSVP